MSQDQLEALLVRLKDDTQLQGMMKDAVDLDAAVTIAKTVGFDVSKADWLNYQAQQVLELSDKELEGIAGGKESWSCPTNGAPKTGGVCVR